jgi:hypothetical protein
MMASKKKSTTLAEARKSHASLTANILALLASGHDKYPEDTPQGKKLKNARAALEENELQIFALARQAEQPAKKEEKQTPQKSGRPEPRHLTITS